MRTRASGGGGTARKAWRRAAGAPAGLALRGKRLAKGLEVALWRVWLRRWVCPTKAWCTRWVVGWGVVIRAVGGG